MASWTVLTHTVPGDTAEQAAGRAVFVREKFSWLTLFFAPLVLLRFRLWLVFAAYVAVAILLGLAQAWNGIAEPVGDAVMIGFHVLLALELPRLRQRKLERLGYEEAAVVVAVDRDEAEHRFFAEWNGLFPPSKAGAALPVIRPSFPAPGGTSGVIGAFPGA